MAERFVRVYNDPPFEHQSTLIEERYLLPTQTPGTGMKFDTEKPRMDLLDPEFLEHVAQVLTFGAKKYAAHNWRGGINYSRLIAAAYRHLGAISGGNDTDSESGLAHVAHLGCCIMFLDWMMNHRPDLDDRYKKDNNA